MHPKTLKFIGSLAILATIFALISIFNAPKHQIDKQVGLLVFPTLLNEVNNVEKIVITRQNDSFTLEKFNNIWTAKEIKNYPVYPARISNVLMGLAQMKYVEVKTSNPLKYKDIGVENPEEADASSIMLKLFDKDNANLAEIIIGKKRFDLSLIGEGLYIRKPNEKHAWLTQTAMDATGKSDLWVIQPILDIRPNKISRIALTTPDGKTAIISKKIDAEDFILEGIAPEKNVLYQEKIQSLVNSLVDLRFTEVEKDMPPVYENLPTYLIQVNTTDGLVVYLDAFEYKSGYWIKAKMETERVPSKQALDVIKNNAQRHMEWIYRIPVNRARPFMTNIL